MRRISLWALSTLSAVVLLFGYSTSTAGPQTGSSAVVAAGGVVSSSLDASGTTGSATTGSSGSDQASGAGDGTVTGDVASTRWGPVQVQLVVADGTITRVNVLQYPDENGKDQEINAYALPILTQETLDAQGAGIDMVSGATVTSAGYLDSLQSALDQANL